MALLTPSHGWPYLHNGDMFQAIFSRKQAIFSEFIFLYAKDLLSFSDAGEQGNQQKLSFFICVQNTLPFCSLCASCDVLAGWETPWRDEPLLGPGDMAEGWLQKGLAELPHSSCLRLSSAVVFKCSTLLPSPLEAEIKCRCWLWRLHQLDLPFFKRGTVLLPAQEQWPGRAEVDAGARAERAH